MTTAKPEQCAHDLVVGSAGLKVCLDCGAPMNAAARSLSRAVADRRGGKHEQPTS
jgi:hypothetical protein